MTSRSARTRIVDVGVVAVPVADQDRALEFYVGRLGFEVRRDVTMPGGGRWVQVAPPGAKTTVALVAAGEGAPVGVDTGITFTSSDVEGDHDDLVSRGVDADEVLHWPGVPVMFAFQDQDGNQLKIIETS